MGILDDVLKSKPLRPWQVSAMKEGRCCKRCGKPATTTAPVGDDADMLRLHCDNCGWLGYEFPPDRPMVIDFKKPRR